MKIGRQFWIVIAFLISVSSWAHAAGELDADLLGAADQQPYQWFASTDADHKNLDYIVLKPGETRSIKLAAGTLVRLWSTALEPTKLKLVLHNGSDITLLENGKAHSGEFYQQAFVLYPTASDPTGLRTLGEDATCSATNLSSQPNKFFYQIAIRLRSSTRVSPLKSASEGFGDVLGPVQPGKFLDLFNRPLGAGVIDSIGVTIADGDVETWKNLRLRAWWDGAKVIPEEYEADMGRPLQENTCAVDVPLLSLAGQFWSTGPVDNAFCSFDGKQLTLHVPMPYAAGALVRLYNKGGKAVNIRAQFQFRDYGSAMPVKLRFCAAQGSTQTQRGKPVEMLKVNEGGVFCGLNLGIDPAPGANRRSFAYLEGNEKMTVDGKSFEGTGTEDFFDSAWYFPDDPYSRPYYGLSFKKKMPPQVAAYRLLVPDAVPFLHTFTFNFEHGNGNNDNDLLYRWVAFWYQKSPEQMQFQISDELNRKPSAGAAGHAGGIHWKRLFMMMFVAGVVLFVYGRRRRG